MCGLEKAHDNVNRELMWQVMDEYGIRGSLAKAVKSMYVNCEACVKIKEGNSEWFPVKKGVRRGCVMSPWLFNVYMDRIVREAKERFSGGVKLEESNVHVFQGLACAGIEMSPVQKEELA